MKMLVCFPWFSASSEGEMRHEASLVHAEFWWKPCDWGCCEPGVTAVPWGPLIPCTALPKDLKQILPTAARWAKEREGKQVLRHHISLNQWNNPQCHKKKEISSHDHKVH